MSVSKNAAAAYSIMRKGGKAYVYYKLAREALDEDTRSGALLRGGIKVSMEVAKKALGSPVTWHPYYTYHKAHFEALSQALNAVNMKAKTLDLFTRAVAAADSTASVSVVLQGYVHRQTALDWEYAFMVNELLNIQARYSRNPSVTLPEIQSIGLTPATLASTIATNLYEWQAKWAELCRDALQLYVMIDAEVRVAEAAMRQYTDKVTKLKEGGSSIGRVAGYAAEQDRQWAIYDRMTDKSASTSDEAVSDPTKFARRQLSLVDTVARRYALCCDVVMNEAVLAPDSVLEKIAAIMKG